MDLLNFKSLKFIIQNFVSQETDELAELMRCFPDNKFAYYFFQLADNKIVKEVRKFLFANIKTNEKIYIPYSVFDDILENDES